MADVLRLSFPAAIMTGDNNELVAAGDLPASPDSPSGRVSMKMVDGAAEHVCYSGSTTIPETWTSSNGAKVRLLFFGDSAPGGSANVRLEVAFECITPGDAHDLHATPGAFAAAQGITAVVNASAGVLSEAEISFTQAQADAIEPGDKVRVLWRRDSDVGANDTYADSVWVTNMDLMEVT